MSTSSHIQDAFLDNLAFSLMGRMHVILRRQNGRVTDIEYMRIDPVYCRFILDLAAKLPNEDLQQICAKLEEIYFGEKGLFVRPPAAAPLITRLTTPALPASAVKTVGSELQGKPEAQIEGAASSGSNQNSAVDQSYVGRLR